MSLIAFGWNIIRRDLRPSGPREEAFAREAMNLNATAMRPVAYVIPLSAMVMVGVYELWGDPAAAMPWALAVSIVCMANEVLRVRFARALKDGNVNTHLWIRLLGSSNLIFAATWGSMGLWLWVPDEPINHMFLTLVLACSFAAAAALNSSSLALGLPPALIYWAMMFAVLLREPDHLHLGTAGLSLAFGILMVFVIGHIRSMTHHVLELREERTGLTNRLKQERDEAQDARNRAENASRAKSEFLAHMSHELRTPLNAILGFSEVMNTEVFGPLGRRIYVEYAGHIHGSGQHLLGLINDILDLSRIEAGRMTLHEMEIDLEAMGRDTLSMFAVRAGQASQTLVLDCAQDLPPIFADQRALRQILLNLLGNAIKFTPTGGRITLFARINATGGMDCGVSDTGVGIPARDHARVFEAFGQAQHDVAVAERGTGLGLPIVKGLAQVHGGTVSLLSAPGQGTTVTVHFPPARVARPQPLAFSPAPNAA